MTEFTPFAGAIGGLLIGLSAVVLMGGIGRIAGISGIFGGVLSGNWAAEGGWRPFFVGGLLLGAVIMALLGGIDADDRLALAYPGGLGGDRGDEECGGGHADRRDDGEGAACESRAGGRHAARLGGLHRYLVPGA